MSYQATVYRIMISSPSDVVAEREIIHKAIHTWNVCNSEKEGIVLLPMDWQNNSTPEMGYHPQEILNKQLVSESDILIAVFWHRIGSPTLKAESGTIEEINEFINTKKPVMLYFSSKNIPSECDMMQVSRLREFKKSCKDKGLFAEYRTDEEFQDIVSRHISNTLNGFKNTRPNGFTKISYIAFKILETAIQKDSHIKYNESIPSVTIKNLRQDTVLGATKNQIKAAMKELIDNRLIFVTKHYKIYQFYYGVTAEGLRYVDQAIPL